MLYEQRLDAVVTDYKTPLDLDRFLTSYADHPPMARGSLTVALVEPTSGDWSIVSKWAEVLFLNVLSFKDNVGYARACNAAARVGTGDVVAFFNADVAVTPESLTRCYDALSAHPDWGVLGPRQVDSQNRFTAGGVFGDPIWPQQRAWQQPDQGQCSDVREDALTVSGAAYFVRRGVWNQMTNCSIYQEVTGGAMGGFLPTPHY